MAGEGMWAYRLRGPSRLERVAVPRPQPQQLGPGEVLLRTLAGGLCGSDLPAFRGYRSALPGDDGHPGSPLTGFPMHEVTGEVVASRHDAHVPGGRVVGWASHFNGLAEYVVTRGDEVIEVDAEMGSALAITLQPLACVLYAAEQLGDIRGCVVAVIGQGPIGLLFSHVLKIRGAATVIGVDPVDRTGVADSFGVDVTVTKTSDTWAAEWDARHAAPSVVVEAVGHQVSTLADAVRVVAPGGQIYYFGGADDDVYPIDMRAMLRKNLTLRSGITLERARVLELARDHARAHPKLAATYVTTVLRFEDAQRAFESAIRPAPEQLKIVLVSPPG